MQAHQRGDGFRQITHHQRNRLLRLILDAVGDELEGAVAGGQLGLGYSIDQFFTHPAVADQFFDGDDVQIVLGGQGEQVIAAGAVAFVVEDFAKHARGS